jgi:hypothetical protein
MVTLKEKRNGIDEEYSKEKEGVTDRETQMDGERENREAA